MRCTYMKKVTIKEIADQAGVSKATVSRVLNHRDIVDKKTCEKVEEVMRKNNYYPSRVARNLANQSTNTIGIIIPEIDNGFYGKILRTIVAIADSEGLVPICLDTDNNEQKDMKALSILKDQQVRGVIYAPSVEYGEKNDEIAMQELMKSLEAPIVLLDRKVPSFQYDGVYFENYKATYSCTKIFLEAGHRNIAVIGGSQKIGIARERLRGYIAALTEYRMEVKEQYIFEGDFTAKTSYRLSREMLKMKERPTAVITFNNTSGLGFLQALTESRDSPAVEIEHIGIDEIDAFDYLHFPYNHVVRSRTDMATEAMRLLIRRIKGEESRPEEILIKPRYILNERLNEIAVKGKLI